MQNDTEINRILKPERILILESKTKKDALQTLAECLAAAPQIKDRDELIKRIFYREGLMSTGIGMGIAVPHVRLASVTEPVMCVGISRNTPAIPLRCSKMLHRPDVHVDRQSGQDLRAVRSLHAAAVVPLAESGHQEDVRDQCPWLRGSRGLYQAVPRRRDRGLR